MFATVILIFLNFCMQGLSIAILSQKKAADGRFSDRLDSTPLDPEDIVLKIQGHAVILQQIRTQT
jgi:hypothetical protein